MISLDENYSTTRLVGAALPQVVKNPENTFVAPSLFAKDKGRISEGGLRTIGYSKHAYKLLDGQWRVCDNGGKQINSIMLDAEKLNLENDCTELPLITIVTVVYNGEKFLEATIQSVINQTYPNVEYIIIDGGSSDRTLDIIRQYEQAIDYWVSEKDNGIYDAMNKGINLATGQWINFMNAGDIFAGSDVLSRVFKNTQYSDVQIIYGDHMINYGDFSVEREAGDIADIWKESQFCHQSAFIHSSFHREKKYNTVYKITADFEFFYVAHVEGARFVRIFYLVSIITPGGVSDTERIKSIVSRMRIVCQNNYNIKFFSYYAVLVIINLFKIYFKKIIPKKYILAYISKKSRNPLDVEDIQK